MRLHGEAHVFLTAHGIDVGLCRQLHLGSPQPVVRDMRTEIQVVLQPEEEEVLKDKAVSAKFCLHHILVAMIESHTVIVGGEGTTVEDILPFEAFSRQEVRAADAHTHQTFGGEVAKGDDIRQGQRLVATIPRIDAGATYTDAETFG